MRWSLCLILPTALWAQAPQLGLPVDCTLGQTCHIQQFADHDPGSGASDYSCGSLTYDGHNGTDFALPSLAAQARGVNVLAAAAGTVVATRDNMPDVLQTGPDAPDVTGRECGNGLVIAHPDGWETQYCHMALGSLVVAPGQTVSAGDVLGQIGLSGETQFPHLHLTLRQDGAWVDPFDPDGRITCGNPSETSLWTEPLAAPPGGIIATGFDNAVPDYAAIKAGTAGRARLSPSEPMVLWVYLFGGRAGDQVLLSIAGPDGTVFDNLDMLDRTQAQLFRAGGRRAPAMGWSTGVYQGQVRVLRDGRILDAQTVTLVVER